MGRSTTPAYRVEFETTGRTLALTPLCWSVKQDGRPTESNLLRLVATMNRSFEPDGANSRVGALGVRITHARLIRQSSGDVVAEVEECDHEWAQKTGFVVCVRCGEER